MDSVYRAAPTGATTLATAVPMSVPATPRREATTAAVIAARQPAISWTKLSSNFGGSLVVVFMAGSVNTPLGFSRPLVTKRTTPYRATAHVDITRSDRARDGLSGG